MGPFLRLSSRWFHIRNLPLEKNPKCRQRRRPSMGTSARVLAERSATTAPTLGKEQRESDSSAEVEELRAVYTAGPDPLGPYL